VNVKQSQLSIALKNVRVSRWNDILKLEKERDCKFVAELSKYLFLAFYEVKEGENQRYEWRGLDLGDGDVWISRKNRAHSHESEYQKRKLLSLAEIRSSKIQRSYFCVKREGGMDSMTNHSAQRVNPRTIFIAQSSGNGPEREMTRQVRNIDSTLRCFLFA
jgi:hypothetical protein